jgi:hypothetical protein
MSPSRRDGVKTERVWKSSDILFKIQNLIFDKKKKE